MKPFYLIVFQLFICSVAHSQTLFEKTYDGVIAGSVKNDTNGFWVFANDEGPNFTSYKLKFLKIDNNGIINDSTVIIIDSNFLYAVSSLKSFNGNYVVVGYQANFDFTQSYGFILKMNPQGDTLWYRHYKIRDFDIFYDVKQTLDGGYIAAGYSYSYSGDDYDYYVVKTDSLGNEQWHASTSTLHGAQSIEPTPDGGYILAGGNNWHLNNVNNTAMILKLDSLGNEQWFVNINMPKYGGFHGVLPTKDGEYLAHGTYDNLLGYFPGYIVKFDSARNIEWQQVLNYNYSKGIFKMKALPSGGYIGCGEGRDTSQSNMVRGNVFKICSEGTVQWMHNYGDTIWPSHLYDIELTPDGGYIAVGSTKGVTWQQDLWVVKMDSLGRKDSAQPFPSVTPCPITSVENEFLVKNKLEVFPNPCSSNINIQLPNTTNEPLYIIEINTGKIIDEFIPLVSEFQYNTNKLKQGVYAIKYGRYIEKFVKINK